MGVEVDKNGVPVAPVGSKLLAEAYGTFMLTLVACCCIAGEATPFFAATAIASALMINVYSMGDISGAHFNPAVTAAIGLAGQIEGPLAAMYMVSQLFGASLGALFSFFLHGKTFNLQPPEGDHWTRVGACELLYTFMLCFVVLNVACSKRTAGNQFFGLAIGYVIVAAGYACGSISGAVINPAISLGIDVISLDKGFGWSLAYVSYQITGASLAALAFYFTRGEAFTTNGQYSIVQKGFAEFLGTFFLVLTIGLNVGTGSPAVAWSIAASLMCMVYALGSVSGAHFNPAVTMSILFSGREKISPNDAFSYIGFQLFGAFMGSGMYLFLTGKAIPLRPVDSSSWGDVMIAECVYTFLLCFVVLTVATAASTPKDVFGLAIGSAITVGGYASATVSGGALNPAAAFAIDISHAVWGGGKFRECIIFGFFEFLGAALAALVFAYTHVGEYQRKGNYFTGTSPAGSAQKLRQ